MRSLTCPTKLSITRALTTTSFIFFVLLKTNITMSQSQFTIDNSTLGIIQDGQKKRLGTAFVCENPSWIISCAHVEKQHPGLKFYKSIKNEVPLKLISIDEKQDIAIYESDTPITERFLKLDTTFQYKVGVEIVYAGFDVRSSTDSNSNIKINRALVQAAGLYKEENVETFFIEFIGEGIPGYSGGPVFNMKGEIIAIFAQSYFRKSLKIGYVDILINRAFSIKGIYDRLKK